jgi:hypothetical protein
VTPIRPAGYPTPPPANPAADAARLSAQRAFFDAALGRAGASRPAQAPAAVGSTAPLARRELRPDPAAEAPAKPLRPGSLLDIRV